MCQSLVATWISCPTLFWLLPRLLLATVPVSPNRVKGVIFVNEHLAKLLWFNVQRLTTYEHEILSLRRHIEHEVFVARLPRVYFLRLFYASRVYFDALVVWYELCVCFERRLDAWNRRIIRLRRIMRLRLFPVFILTHNASQTNNASSKINTAIKVHLGTRLLLLWKTPYLKQSKSSAMQKVHQELELCENNILLEVRTLQVTQVWHVLSQYLTDGYTRKRS